MVSLGLLVLRMITGTLFAIHGYTKVFGGPGKSETIPPEAKAMLGPGFTQFMDYGGVDNLTGYLQSIDIPNPKPVAYALMATEFLGGLALIFGWKTRLAATVLTASQLVAIQKVHGKNGLITSEDGGFELNAALTAATATLVLTGPGKIAAD